MSASLKKKSKVKIAARAALAFLLILGVLFYTLPLPGQIPVLMYHFIGSREQAAEHKNYVSRKSFAAQMKFLARHGYRVISLEEYYQIKSGQQKPRGKEIVITFDDGNYSFAEDAVPALEKYKFPVTVFLVSKNLKEGLHGSMSIDTVKGLLSREWISIGSHSRTHPDLAKLTEDEIREELYGARQELEKIFERPVPDLAYPSGSIDERVIKIAQEAGCRQAFTTSQKKLKGLAEGPFASTRSKIDRSSDWPFVFWLHVSGIYSSVKNLRRHLKQR